MRTKTENLQLGRFGEQKAAEYLRKKGYRIVEQNYRTRYAEIDLVAQRKDALVVVEVRTKVGERFGTPEETLNARKLRKVKMNAAAYAQRAQWKKLCRVDAICIVLNEDKTVAKLHHYENI